MKKGKLLSLLLAGIMVGACFIGCGSTTAGNKDSNSSSNSNVGSDGYKHFSAFFTVPGKEIPDGNRMKKKIADKTGVWCDETWLTGQTSKERIGVMIAGGEYPDLIQGEQSLIDAGALIELDDYIDSGKYPNITNYFTKKQWDKARSPDGHIYMIPQFARVQGRETGPTQGGEAFWIQKKVLEWAGFPTIKTLDQYFDLIEKYKAANPTIDGQPTIGFEILCYDWRYFCLENPPQFLAGYPNDGKAIVDKDTLTAHIYDTIPEAKAYYKKLGEEFNKGIIDPEIFTANYDQYISKLSTGAVLGMIDQGWQFNNAKDALVQQGKDERTWVPLPIVMNENIKPHYVSKTEVNGPGGISITKDCKDIDGALQFINDLLEPDVITMRSWGEKGVDYEVGDDGVFYRTQEQRDHAKDQDWVNQNMCPYSYFPSYQGMMADGKNTVSPGDQPDEFYASLCDTDKKILDAYGYKTFTEFMDTPEDKNEPWYPIYTYVDALDASSEAALAHQKMDDLKKQWLPKVIMTDPSDFENVWNEYTTTLIQDANCKAYEDALTQEVRRRVKEFGDD